MPACSCCASRRGRRARGQRRRRASCTRRSAPNGTSTAAARRASPTSPRSPGNVSSRPVLDPELRRPRRRRVARRRLASRDRGSAARVPVATSARRRSRSVPAAKSSRSFFGPVMPKAPKGDEAVALWNAVATLAFSDVAELKRTSARRLRLRLTRHRSHRSRQGAHDAVTPPAGTSIRAAPASARRCAR